MKLDRSVSSYAVVTGVALSAAVFSQSARAADPSKLEADSFLVELAPLGSYQVGVPSSVQVTLGSKGAFHINGAYPYRFKMAQPPDGITYPKPILERSDAEFTEKTVVFKLPFVPTRAGSFLVGGVFHLSVCSASNCVVQKVPLEVTVRVP